MSPLEDLQQQGALEDEQLTVYKTSRTWVEWSPGKAWVACLSSHAGYGRTPDDALVELAETIAGAHPALSTAQPSPSR